LEAGQDFNFVEFDELSYSAVNKAAFTGGAERQVTVVTQDDMDKLEKSLLASLSQKAKDDLKNQAGGKDLQDGAIVVDVKKSQFDKSADEEAALVNLDMEVEANALIYSEDDLKKMLAEIFGQDIEKNQQIRSENINLTDLQIERLVNGMTISGIMKTKLVPKFAEDELKDKIRGKSIKDARAQVKSISQDVSQVEVNFKPNIPIIGTIPKNKDKISFKIETI